MNPRPAIAHNLLLQTQEVLQELDLKHRLWVTIAGNTNQNRTDIDVRNINGKGSIVCYTIIHNDGISLYNLIDPNLFPPRYDYTYEDPELIERWRTNLTGILKDWQDHGP